MRLLVTSINFMFEASVGGGIPIIRALNSSLTADRIDSDRNSEWNNKLYADKRCSFESADYDEVLKEAQEKKDTWAGNQEADVEGHDAVERLRF